MGIKVYDEKYKTVNQNSIELVKGLDRSLADDGVGSCDKVAQLKTANESLQEMITQTEEQNAKLREELAAALREIDQFKRGAKVAKKTTTGKRKPRE